MKKFILLFLMLMCMASVCLVVIFNITTKTVPNSSGFSSKPKKDEKF